MPSVAEFAFVDSKSGKITYTPPSFYTAATGYSKRHIYNLMRDRKFPLALKLSTHAVGWFADEIDSWQDKLRRVELEGAQEEEG